MRRWLLGAVLLALLGSGAGAQDAQGAIREVISDQIAAFEADDFATAFTFASPAIREIFGTPTGSAGWCARAIRWCGARAGCASRA